MLKEPNKYFNFWDWTILINKAANYNFLIDRKYSKILLMASSSGGSNIEDVAINNPNKIFSYHFHNINENNKKHLLDFANQLSLNANQSNEFVL